MKGYGMVIDVARCNGCYSCVLACKDEHCGEVFAGYTEPQPMTGQFWINLVEKERGAYPKVKLSYIPITCMHCRTAPCIDAAYDNAVYRRPDGIVIIDPIKARGQKQIVSACPYRVIFWNEEKNTPQKCTTCAHLLDDGWKRPRCVEMCPTGALTFGDLSDPESEVSKKVASLEPYPLHPEYKLSERVLYLNVPKKFVAGTVVYRKTDQCAGKVSVTLKGDGAHKSCVTDGFGDFWFEDLNSNAEYTLEIAHDGFQRISRTVHTYSDVVLGEVLLEQIA
jgi:Fe-S-cluster-containing dehydrogenase component